MKKRDVTLDYLKVVLAVLVVGLHAGFLEDVSPLLSFVTVNGLFRIAVPLFFVISGYYFFHISEKGRVAKWAKRLILLYVVWMLIYLQYWWRVPTGKREVIFFVRELLMGYYHLWYISGLLLAGLIVHFLRRHSKLTAIAAVGLCIVGIGTQYAGDYGIFGDGRLHELSNYNWSHRNFIFFAFPYIASGYLIAKHKVDGYSNKRVLVACCLFSLVLLMAESTMLFYSDGRTGGVDNLASLVLAAPLTFLAVKKFRYEGDSRGVAASSTALYFIHPMILQILKPFVAGGTLLTATCLAACIPCVAIILWFNQRLKVLV